MTLMIEEYERLAKAYSFFNEHLFDGRLSNPPLLTLANEKGCYGTFAPNYLQRREGDGLRSIINLNPSDFNRRDELILSTLVHEMTHDEQHRYGKPGKKGYHNREWVFLMERIGLIPVNNKNPKLQTGTSITHHILEDGPFHVAVNKLMETGWKLEWKEIDPTPAQSARALAMRKVKYYCECVPNVRVWGKPGLQIFCPNCQKFFREAS